MALHPKALASISQKVKAIEDGLFDETHIEALLIQIREHVFQRSWAKELGDFIAHGERDRGLFYDEVNRNALAIKIQLRPPDAYQLDLRKMPQVIFLMLRSAVSHYNNKYWIAELGINQKDINKLLDEVYEFHKLTKSYVLKKSLSYSQFKRTELIVHAALSPIHFREFTTIQEIVKDLEREMSRLLKAHKIPYNGAIQEHADEVGLCVLSLLQGMSMRLFDGSIGYLLVDTYSFSESGNPDHDAPSSFIRLSCAVPVMDSPPLQKPLPIISLFIGSSLLASVFIDPAISDIISGHDIGFTLYTKRDATGALKLAKHE